MHIGNARSALFNWLYARHTGGTFILRIEDTDVTRSTQEATDQIQQVLHWLGLEWDEGPLLQSHRFETYLSAADRMVDAGHAYECFCLEAEVKERNEEAIKAGRKPGYDGRCRDLAPSERDAHASSREATIDPFPHRGGRSQCLRGRDSRGGGGRLVDDLGLRDRAIERHARLLPRERARRHRHADHPRVARRRPHRLDPPGARARAARSVPKKRRYTPTSRSSPDPAAPSCRSGTARRTSRTIATPDISRHALVNYLALLGWAPEGDREILDIEEIVAEFDIPRINHSAAGVRPEEARVDERGAHPPLAGRGARRRRAAVRQVEVRANTSTSACSNLRSGSPRSAPRHSCRSPSSRSSSSPRTTPSRSTPTSFESIAKLERVDEVLDAAIDAHRDVRAVASRRDRPPPGHREPRASSRART